MKLEWIQTSHGSHERPLGVAEIGMSSMVASVTDREPLRIQAWAEFTSTSARSSEDICSACRTAWKALRVLRSPDIATTFDSSKKFYKVPDAADLERWADETFTIEKTGSSVDTVIAKSHEVANPMPLAYIIPEERSEGEPFSGILLMLISHWRTEASGAYKMLSQIFDYALDILKDGKTVEKLRDHIPGQEVSLLTPTAEDIWNTETTANAKERVAAHFKNYYAHLPSIDYAATGELSAMPSNDGAYQRVYNAETTTEIVRACKGLSLSVTSAIHSAFVGVMYRISSVNKQSHSYASLMPAQVRKRLPVSSPYRENGCWDAARPLMLALPSGLDFKGRAQSLSQQYSLANSEHWLREDLHEIYEHLNTPPPGTPPIPQSMGWFTSFGVLDNGVIEPDHGEFSIHRVAAWADNVGPGIVLTAWTFKDQMNIQISWNFAYHTSEQINQTLDLIDEEFRHELGVTIAIDETRGVNRLY